MGINRVDTSASAGLVKTYEITQAAKIMSAPATKLQLLIFDRTLRPSYFLTLSALSTTNLFRWTMSRRVTPSILSAY